MTEQVFITEDELSIIQKMNADFNKAKTGLGDIEMEKYNILRAIEGLKSAFAEHEKTLIAKYGADAVINLQTGEVTQKQQ